jgi:hypothetical protein
MLVLVLCDGMGDYAGRLTLSPKPHIRARIGCCSTVKLKPDQLDSGEDFNHSYVPVHSVVFLTDERLERVDGAIV